MRCEGKPAPIPKQSGKNENSELLHRKFAFFGGNIYIYIYRYTYIYIYIWYIVHYMRCIYIYIAYTVHHHHHHHGLPELSLGVQANHRVLPQYFMLHKHVSYSSNVYCCCYYIIVSNSCYYYLYLISIVMIILCNKILNRPIYIYMLYITCVHSIRYKTIDCIILIYLSCIKLCIYVYMHQNTVYLVWLSIPGIPITELMAMFNLGR